MKLRRGKSTKAERIFAERLKKMHIPFKTKFLINNREVDFLIGKYAIDIDGHEQDEAKNVMLVGAGYTPLHVGNRSASTISINYLKEYVRHN